MEKIVSVIGLGKLGAPMAPRFCFEQNDMRLPSGCHAWPKYDRKFWEPYLLEE
jgi:hypothetical protein